MNGNGNCRDLVGVSAGQAAHQAAVAKLLKYFTFLISEPFGLVVAPRTSLEKLLSNCETALPCANYKAEELVWLLSV